MIASLSDATQVILPATPDIFLESIGAGETLPKKISTSGGETIYADLHEFIEAQRIGLRDHCGDSLITKKQLVCWVDSRTKKARDLCLQLASGEDLGRGTDSLDSPSVVYLNVQYLNRWISDSLKTELISISKLSDDISIWAEGLCGYINDKIQENIECKDALKRESHLCLESRKDLVGNLPEEFGWEQCIGFLEKIESAYMKELEIIVICFANEILENVSAAVKEFL